MAGSKNRSIHKLSDLPNFKMNFPHALNEMGITTPDELKEALMDASRTASLVRNVNGLGPKIIETWKDALISESTRANDVSASIVSCGEGPFLSEDSISTHQSSEDAPVNQLSNNGHFEELIDEGILNTPPSGLRSELRARNLFCDLDDIQEVKQTLIELLKWNGAKRKGLASMIKYVVQKLRDAGLMVSMVNDDEGDPLFILASKGEGGLVLWGHLDTAREGNMDDALQGIVALDFVYGRGVVDMKGALAVLLCAATRMAKWDVPFTIVLTTDALDEQDGAQYLAYNPIIRKSKGILLLAPTEMTPAYGQVGRLDMNVTIFGEDSILATLRFLDTLNKNNDILPGQRWLRAGLIRGGKRGDPFGPVNSCQTSFRILTAFPTEDIVDTVEDVLHDSDHLTEIVWRSEPVELDRESWLVKETEKVLGKDARLCDVRTEAGRLLKSNPNICIFGPGNPYNSRLANESLVLTDLEKTYELILSLVDSTAVDYQML